MGGGERDLFPSGLPEPLGLRPRSLVSPPRSSYFLPSGGLTPSPPTLRVVIAKRSALRARRSVFGRFRQNGVKRPKPFKAGSLPSEGERFQNVSFEKIIFYFLKNKKLFFYFLK